MSCRRRSDSFVDFIERLKEIDELQNAARFTGIPRNPRRIMALNRSSVVMLCSHLEGYIEDVLEEAIDYLDTLGIESAKIPDSLKLAHSIPAIKRILETSKPEKRCLELIDLFSRHYYLWTPCPSLPKGSLNPDVIVRQLSNPTPDMIVHVFKSVGINDIFDYLAKRYTLQRRTVFSFIRPTIANFVQIRHSIAHGDHASFVTSQDVRRYMNATLRLCKAIDYALGLFIKDLTGNMPWSN